jgi:hypothetical protein
LPSPSFSGPSPAGLMTTFYCLRFESPPIWRPKSLYLYPPEQGGPVIPPGTGFPFRRLLRLAGWRYSTPLPYGAVSLSVFLISTSHGLHGKYRLLVLRIVLGVFTAPLHYNGRGTDNIKQPFYCWGVFTAGMGLPSRCLATGIHFTIATDHLFKDQLHVPSSIKTKFSGTASTAFIAEFYSICRALQSLCLAVSKNTPCLTSTRYWSLLWFVGCLSTLCGTQVCWCSREISRFTQKLNVTPSLG